MTRIEMLASAVAMIATGGIGAGVAVYSQTAPTCFTNAPAVKTVIVQPAAPPQARTVSYFLAHRDELKQRYAACQDNPALELTDSDCINAVEAKDRADLADFRRSNPWVTHP